MKTRFTACLSMITLVAAVLAIASPSHAYVAWEGGDWGGRDLIPANGDILSGTFTNIGRFVINAGDTVYAGPNQITVNANEIVINGLLSGPPTLSLRLSSLAEITVSGLNLPTSVTMTAGTVSQGPSSGSISVINGNLGEPVVGTLPDTLSINQSQNLLLVSPSDTVSAVPLPPALLLFAPGLAVMALVRRRSLT